jgi:hypothetical protein
VGRDLGVHLMRFVLMEGLASPAETTAFLDDLIVALETFVGQMETHIGTAPLPGKHPRLALEHGLAVHHASLDWARSTRAELSTSRPRSP